jgi:hypothetical protein
MVVPPITAILPMATMVVVHTTRQATPTAAPHLGAVGEALRIPVLDPIPLLVATIKT